MLSFNRFSVSALEFLLSKVFGSFVYIPI
uniref:Uncharacterized protein n=1 Tax=Anguilla anguilla TaxID=7936 RepID=A0A0E9VE45_ANGAN